MGHITVWACGDLSTAIKVCADLRMLGCEARVHNPHPDDAGATPWRRGPQVLVGDGKDIPHLDPTGSTDLLAFGEAAGHALCRIGGRVGRRPPGLIPAIRTLTCRRERGFLGPRNTHFPVEGVAAPFDVVEIPKGWTVEAVESRGDPAAISGTHSILCFFSPRGRCMTSVLDKVTRRWQTRRTDPVERAENRARMLVADQVPRGAIVVLGYSGGLTSTVSAYVLQRELRERVIACCVQTGLEPVPIAGGVSKSGLEIMVVDAREDTLATLRGTIYPEERRKLLGKIFYKALTSAYPGALLSQGATYESMLLGKGKPANEASGLVQPLETLCRKEVEAIAERRGLQVSTPVGPPSGYADLIEGPFTKEALLLCRLVDRTLSLQLAEARTPTPDLRTRHTFTVNAWDPRYPTVCFGFEESDCEGPWRRMRIRDGGLDIIVEALRADTRIPDLKVMHDVSLPLA